MGQNFDFGQFQQIMDYLSQKLSEGGALTPEEQQIYDALTGIANQGLNLTGTADFQSLQNAFSGLADQATKDAFEKTYGTGIIQNGDGTISFTHPGTAIEAMQRRGLSVNDGPAMAVLSEGLKNYLQTIAQNKFAAMTNAYQDMTPIRAQNIQALTNAGGIASTAIGRRVPPIGAAVGGASDSGSGEGVSIDTSGGPNGPKSPSFMDKYGGALLGLLGAGGLGIGGYLLKNWWENRNKTPEGDILAREASGSPDRNPYTGDYLNSSTEMTGNLSPESGAYMMPNAYTTPYNPNTLYNFNTPQQQTMSGPVDQWWNQGYQNMTSPASYGDTFGNQNQSSLSQPWDYQAPPQYDTTQWYSGGDNPYQGQPPVQGGNDFSQWGQDYGQSMDQGSYSPPSNVYDSSQDYSWY